VSWSHVLSTSALVSACFSPLHRAGIRWAEICCIRLLQGPQLRSALPEAVLQQAIFILPTTPKTWAVRIISGHILINRPARRQTHASLIAWISPGSSTGMVRKARRRPSFYCGQCETRCDKHSSPFDSPSGRVGYFNLTLLLFAPFTLRSFVARNIHTSLLLSRSIHKLPLPAIPSSRLLELLHGRCFLPWYIVARARSLLPKHRRSTLNSSTTLPQSLSSTRHQSCASDMAPSATDTEIEHINHLVLTEKDINIEHNVDDHVAFGTYKVLPPLPFPPHRPRLPC
jgi:hypothetical protein